MTSCTRPASILLCAAVLHWAGAAYGGPADPEIEYLLTAIGQSGCSFVRNGTEHASGEAEDHLRMKYRKGARHIDTAEDFIEKVASGSFLSGRPYQVRCPGEAEQAAASWLQSRLQEHRRGERDPSQSPQVDAP
jgi:hypothetical protein